MIRDFMLDQHQQFFEQQQQLFVAGEDDQGNVWASVIYGRLGFIRILGPCTLQISIKDLINGDDVYKQLSMGSQLGLLGIEFSTRRRNRLNVEVFNITHEEITLKVKQSFGNCPKYIQQRTTIANNPLPTSKQIIHGLTQAALNIIQNADTAFLATRHTHAMGDNRSGFDASHRGGKPGFIVHHDNQLWLPDFSGNNFFNTLGNLVLDPSMGMLILDFESQRYLQLSGKGKVEIDSDRMPFDGYKRAIAFDVNQGVIHECGIPWQFSDAEYSPFIPSTNK